MEKHFMGLLSLVLLAVLLVFYGHDDAAVGSKINESDPESKISPFDLVVGLAEKDFPLEDLESIISFRNEFGVNLCFNQKQGIIQTFAMVYGDQAHVFKINKRVSDGKIYAIRAYFEEEPGHILAALIVRGEIYIFRFEYGEIKRVLWKKEGNGYVEIYNNEGGDSENLELPYRKAGWNTRLLSF